MIAGRLLLTRRDFLRSSSLASGLIAVSPMLHTNAAGWDGVPEILARIRAPKFPRRDFNIAAYGAVGDGTKDCSQALKQAIDACSRAGGGRVVLPAGNFLTGAIHLRSNINLHISKGATLLFNPDPRLYLPVVYTRWEGVECMNYSPFIYAFEQENIAVTGPGTLDGQGNSENWWLWTGRRNGPNQAAGLGCLRKTLSFGIAE